MKKYTAPKITCDSVDEGSFAIPAIVGVVVGVVAAKLASKAVDSMIERSVSFNAKKLEPILSNN